MSPQDLFLLYCVAAWPLCDRAGGADSDLRFPQDKLLDGRDMIPSYGVVAALAQERGGG